MAADPVGKPLRPGRLGVGEAGRAEHRDEDLRGSPLAGAPVDHDRHTIAGIVDEQLVAGGVRLAHRHRQAAFPGAVELAEPRIAIATGLACDVLLPQDRQRHVLALELAVHRRPVRLGLPAMTPPGAGTGPALAYSRASSAESVMPSGNGQLSPAASNRRIVSRTVEGADPTRRAISRLGIPAAINRITSRTWRIASLSVGIQVPLRKAERTDRIGARRGLVTPGDIIPEWWARSSRNGWATSNRNGGRDHSGMVGEIERNQHPLAFSSTHSFRRLSDVHNCRRIGSPRVTGSSSDLRSESRVGSSAILDLRPPPRRRIRSSPTEARSSRSSSPRYIVRRARPVALAMALTPPCPIIRASDAAQRRRLRSSSRGAIDFQRFRRVLISEALITRRF